MAKDYAKYHTKNSVGRKKSNKGGKSWIIILFLIIAVIVGMLYFNKSKIEEFLLKAAAPNNQIDKKKVFISSKKTVASAKIDNDNSHNVSPEAKFDFYTILPKEQVKVSQQPLNQSPNIKYFLQTGVVSSENNANHMKAELALLGFEASVEQFNNGETLAYRIVIGPYYSEDEAKNDQQKLSANKIKSVIIR